MINKIESIYKSNNNVTAIKWTCFLLIIFIKQKTGHLNIVLPDKTCFWRRVWCRWRSRCRWRSWRRCTSYLKCWKDCLPNFILIWPLLLKARLNFYSQYDVSMSHFKNSIRISATGFRLILPGRTQQFVWPNIVSGLRVAATRYILAGASLANGPV